MRQLTIGPLLGLHDFRQEAYATALHLRYLQQNFPEVELSVSLPRIRPLLGSFEPESPVSDRRFVQLLTAFRLLFPTVGITVSTRESQQMRDGVLPLGVTKMSAGVSTAVGGHSGDKSETQFEISDGRGVEELKNHLQARGFQPVMHDWHTRLSGLAG
jgi:2-iminoacetate synthase